MSRFVRIGTRGSPLALRQTETVAEQLRYARPDLEIETVVIRTTGDRSQHNATAGFSERGLFAKELEQALLNGDINVAVHSLKDLPTIATPGLVIAAIPERVDPRDVVHAARPEQTFDRLPAGSRIGTSSARRTAQLRNRRPDLEYAPIRGNVGTRIQKADEGQYDAIVLAAAGLVRLGMEDRITEYLSIDVCLPEAGQGALAVQIAADGAELATVLQPLEHAPTRIAVEAERLAVVALGGGCSSPTACHATIDSDGLVLRGVVASVDGSRLLSAEITVSLTELAVAGERLAAALFALGAADLDR